MSKNEGKLWFAPFGEAPYLVDSHSTTEGKVSVYLPGISGKNRTLYRLSIDSRQQRVLVVIDGWLLPGSLRHRKDRLQSVSLGTKTISEEHFRETDSDWPGCPKFGRVTTSDGNFIITEISRHFLFLQTGNYCLATLDRDSFAVHYTVVTVSYKKDGEPCVERLLVGG